MARIPGAVWDPVADKSERANRPVRMIVHTAWVDAPDIYGPRRGQGNSYAHFYNPTRGSMRQHQDVLLMAYAETGYANSYGNVSVEHQDERREMPLSDSQIDNDARLFAYLVHFHGVPNRIATPDDTRGLAWHRLGCAGNFGAFRRGDPTTWSRAQTGMHWSTSYGKTCPTNARIRQIPEIFLAAQDYLADYRRGGAPGVITPAPEPLDPLEETMAWYDDRQDFEVRLAQIVQKFVPRATFDSGVEDADGKRIMVNLATAVRWSHKIGREARSGVAEVNGRLAGLEKVVEQIAAGEGLDFDAVRQAAYDGAHAGAADVNAADVAELLSVRVKTEED